MKLGTPRYQAALFSARKRRQRRAIGCAPPEFSPPAGAYVGAQSVEITTETPGARIYYTTNGDTPTTASTLYSGAVNVAASATLKALAVRTSWTPSEVAEAAYTIS